MVRQLVRQLVYTIFISNNHASFHLRGRANLVKHQKSQNIMKMIVGLFTIALLRLLTIKPARVAEASWTRHYHYWTTLHNKVWAQIMQSFKTCWKCVAGSRRWETLAMVPAKKLSYPGGDGLHSLPLGKIE